MNRNLIVALLVFASASVLVLAADMFANIEGTYDNQGYVVSPLEDVGYRFTPSFTGRLTGFTLAMNNLSTAGTSPRQFTLGIYTNSLTNTLGTALGFWEGASTGFLYSAVDRAVTFVPATAGNLQLTAGNEYWLVASSESDLIWSWVDDGVRMPTYFTNAAGSPNYGDFNAGVFSVQAEPVPEPATLLVATLGSAVLLRKRRS